MNGSQDELPIEGVRPNDLARLRQLASEFRSACGRNYLPGVVGAVDGLVVKVRKPRSDAVENPRAYWNRKV